MPQPQPQRSRAATAPVTSRLTDEGRPLQFVCTMRRSKGPRHRRAHGKEESEVKAKKNKAIVIDAQEFRSEAEEAEWWDRQRDLIADPAAETRPPRRRAHKNVVCPPARHRY
jgi:hypothetical protein